MKIQDLLTKKLWSRRVFNKTDGKPSFRVLGESMQPMTLPGGNYLAFDQEKIMNELHSGAHIIYDCEYRSMRPKYKYNKETRKNEPDGFQEVTRTAVSWQEAIRTKKTATCGGNAPFIKNESGPEDSERVSKIKSQINTLKLSSALLSNFNAIMGTGDGALYFYIEDGEISWKCFSYEMGDNCNETQDYEDPTKKMGIRMFDYQGKTAVELYRSKSTDLYISFQNDEEVKKYFPSAANLTKTEDGFYLISSTPHELGESAFCYYRENDVPWGPAQTNIEDYENIMSDLGENNKYYAYQMLWISGGLINLPEANFGGKVIGSKTTDGDAKILEPADASNTLELSFKKTYEAICDGSSSVFVKPENLKGQNDSGAYIANLYWPEIQWAILFYSRYHPCMRKILRIIKKLTGIIEQDIMGYSKVQLSYKFEPFIPKNKLEQSQILQNGVASGYLSIETATEESDSTNPMEMERLKKEAEAKEERMAKAALIQQPNIPKEGDE